MDEATQVGDDRGTVVDASISARGWSGIQLAVLAFIGFCGVITDGRPDLPRWLQTTAAVLSLLALSLACVAVFLVGSVAWPLSSPVADGPVSGARPSGRRRLRLGAVLTFAAVAVMALAASANWWPVGDDETGNEFDSAAPPLVEAVDGVGNRWCGRLVASDGGVVLIATARGDAELALGGLAALAPVERC